MRSRLDAIADWKRVARKCGYRVDKIAQNVGLTTREIERYFSKRYRLSPKEWVDNLRMADARRCLQRGMTIKEVALRLGFKHAQDFSRAYGRINGAPPSQLRHFKIA